MRLQFAQTHQNQMSGDLKNIAWSDEPQILPQHLDIRVNLWHKQHNSIESPCVSMFQADGVVAVWQIFLWPVSTNWGLYELHSLPDYSSLNLYPFMTTVCFQQDNAPSHKAQTISNWFLEHEFNVFGDLHSHQISAPLGVSEICISITAAARH